MTLPFYCGAGRLPVRLPVHRQRRPCTCRLQVAALVSLMAILSDCIIVAGGRKLGADCIRVVPCHHVASASRRRSLGFLLPAVVAPQTGFLHRLLRMPSGRSTQDMYISWIRG